MTYPRQGPNGQGLEEVPAAVPVILTVIVLCALLVGCGPSFCAWDRRVQAEQKAYFDKQDAWDRACVKRKGVVMDLGKGSTPDAICVVDGKIFGSR
jgi:hypothetical protein